MTNTASPHEFEPLLDSPPQRWGPGTEPRRKNWSRLSAYQHPTTVTHGSGVIDDLVAGIRRFRSTAIDDYWSRLTPATAGIGCVPWLTDLVVIDELAALGALCVVVDKHVATRRSATLHDRANALSSAFLDGFEELTSPDSNGHAPVIGPQRTMTSPGLVEPVSLGPVRVAGWTTKDGRKLPLLHSKMLVLGVTTYYDDDEMFAGDILRFNPLVTWMGSANWTEASRKHVEHGMWSTDPALVFNNYDYLCSLIALSESLGSLNPKPTPEFVSAVWDDDAFKEYFDEFCCYEDDSDDSV